MVDRRTRTVKVVDNTAPGLKIEAGKVVEVERPLIEEVEIEEGGEVPQHIIHTEKGDAIYEVVGNCWDCSQQGIEMPVFKCVSHPIRADEQMGNQLAAFWNDGWSCPLCMNHYRNRQGLLPKQTVTYEVIEKRW